MFFASTFVGSSILIMSPHELSTMSSMWSRPL